MMNNCLICGNLVEGSQCYNCGFQFRLEVTACASCSARGLKNCKHKKNR